MWTKVWPTEPGWYWIYRLPRGGTKWILETCRVHRTSNSLAYVAGAMFLYKEEQSNIYWHPLTPPEYPPEDLQ